MSGSFFDVLGVVTAFLSVILLLSLIVTGLVQVTQAGLGLRGRNLRFALTQLLKRFAEDRPIGESAARQKADAILDRSVAALLFRKSDQVLGRWIGPAVSWLDTEELESVLEERRDGKSGQGEKASGRADAEAGAAASHKVVVKNKQNVVKKFDAMRRPMEKRLQRSMRIVAVVWAFAVAAAFQVSTPDLLRDLSEAPSRDAPATVDPETDMAGAVEDLARLEIDLWGDPDFYRDPSGWKLRNVLGVALTGLLLTFGAPFWFDRLKEVAALRDALQKPSPSESDASSGGKGSSSSGGKGSSSSGG